MIITVKYSNIDYTATVSGNHVSIDAGGHWAGDGALTAAGAIVDASCIIPEGAFEALEAAISAGRADRDTISGKTRAELYSEAGLA